MKYFARKMHATRETNPMNSSIRKMYVCGLLTWAIGSGVMKVLGRLGAFGDVRGRGVPQVCRVRPGEEGSCRFGGASARLVVG